MWMTSKQLHRRKVPSWHKFIPLPKTKWISPVDTPESLCSWGRCFKVGKAMFCTLLGTICMSSNHKTQNFTVVYGPCTLCRVNSHSGSLSARACTSDALLNLWGIQRLELYSKVLLHMVRSLKTHQESANCLKTKKELGAQDVARSVES